MVGGGGEGVGLRDQWPGHSIQLGGHFTATCCTTIWESFKPPPQGQQHHLLSGGPGRRTPTQRKVKKSVGPNQESGRCAWQGGRPAGCPCCHHCTSVQKHHKVSAKVFFFSITVPCVEAVAGVPLFLNTTVWSRDCQIPSCASSELYAYKSVGTWCFSVLWDSIGSDFFFSPRLVIDTVQLRCLCQDNDISWPSTKQLIVVLLLFT